MNHTAPIQFKLELLVDITLGNLGCDLDDEGLYVGELVTEMENLMRQLEKVDKTIQAMLKEELLE